MQDASQIRLWTYHPRDFSLLQGRINRDLSTFRDDPHILAAYDGLKTRLGTDQIIWCYTEPGSCPETSRCVYEWKLLVPINRILKFYDSVVWNRIIKRPQFVLPEIQRRQIQNEAVAKYPSDEVAMNDFIRIRNHEIWNMPEPLEGWWSNLFVNRPDRCGSGIEALILHPIDSNWVVCKRDWGIPNGS